MKNWLLGASSAPCFGRPASARAGGRAGTDVRATTPFLHLAMLAVVLAAGFVGAPGQSARADEPGAKAVDAVPRQTASDADDLGATGYLAAAERLALRFRGYAELTGDYRVSPDRTISVPVIGRLSIAGLDMAGLETLLAARTAEVTHKDAYVTVEIAAYRPVFVTGLVKNPGSIEWRPGLVVLQAVALTGGQVATPTMGGAPGGPSLQEMVRLQKAVDSQKRDLALLARLGAERDPAAALSVPPQLISLVGVAEAEELIARERETLASNRDALASKLNTLQQGIEAGSVEIASMREQIGKLNAQLQMRRDYLQNVKDLFGKGITTAGRTMEEEIKVSDLEEKITNINVGLAKTAGTVAELQFNAVAMKRDREVAIDAELAKVEREVSQLALEIEAGRGGADELPQKASTAMLEKPSIVFQIVRKQGNASTTIAASQDTAMRPGDVLVVGRGDLR